MVKKSTYIFDLDGTLADQEHRQHLVRSKPKNWDAFFSLCHLDQPITPIIDIALALKAAGHTLVLFSGRSMLVKTQTMRWLEQYGLSDVFERIYMRPIGDHRDDCVLKTDMYNSLPKHLVGTVAAVFDDRQKVVDMWREKGLICLQVAPGNF